MSFILRAAVVLLPLLFATGCGSMSVYTSGSRHAELGRTKGPGERTQIYELVLAGNNRDITLVVRTEYEEERAHLGMEVYELGKDIAQERLLTPYSGLFVDFVERGSAADKAGIIPGDVLVSLDDLSELIYLEQYDHIVQSRLTPGEPVQARIRRPGKAGQEVEVTLVPDGRPEEVVTTRSVALQPPWEGGVDYTGMIYGTLPAEWSETIYGEARPSVLIGGVYIGSPGYRAGLRSGDRILSLGGQLFDSADQLKDYLQEVGPREETVQVEVYQVKGGRYRTELDIEDYHGDVDIRIPLVFDLEDNFVETDWDVGPFGILMNYEGRYKRSSGREVNYYRDFSFLLGLFGREWWPGGQETTLFWFIDIES